MSAVAQRIGAVIPGVLQQAAKRRGALLAIQQRWRRLVGPALAAHTKPVSLRRGQLVVQAEGPGESFTLSYQRPRLLARLREATKGRVEEIVIRPGNVRH